MARRRPAQASSGRLRRTERSRRCANWRAVFVMIDLIAAGQLGIIEGLIGLVHQGRRRLGWQAPAVATPRLAVILQ